MRFTRLVARHVIAVRTRIPFALNCCVLQFFKNRGAEKMAECRGSFLSFFRAMPFLTFFNTTINARCRRCLKMINQRLVNWKKGDKA